MMAAVRPCFIVACLLAAVSPVRAGAASPLFARGYAVLPAPQKVTLSGGDVDFGPSWRIETNTRPNSSAVAALSDLERRHSLPGAAANGTTVVRLAVLPGSVSVGDALDRDRDALVKQAYRLRIRPREIAITANAEQGLFYGIETLDQLLKPHDGKLLLPEGDIEDWPDLRMRNIYWDDAHHLDRPEALKRAIRQAAFFKINGFVIKLEGHFQFHHAPAVVGPYALSPAELQELTDYGLRYHVQLIPYLDGPAHIAFILKHPEYARLRAFPDSNYELCATNPDSYKLLEGMFQDLLDANRGVSYIFLSTDEPYYIGWADNPQCNEKAAAERLGSRGKLLAEFVSKIGGFLHDRGREVVFWGEHPLLAGDIPSLPPFLINGETYGPEFDAAFHSRGIRQMIYTSTQGEERIFPEYFPLPDSRRLHPAPAVQPRAQEVFDKVSFDRARGTADLLGAVVAGWADAGQHPENFWLGYAVGTAAAWHPRSPNARELTASFYSLFYGPRVVNMDRAYQLLSYQAQVWADSWDRADSRSRKGIWGNSDRIFTPRRPARDQAIVLPPAPDATLQLSPGWKDTNARRLQLAGEFLAENDELLGILDANLLRASSNRYNIEVLLSDTLLCRQNLEFLLALGRIDDAFAAAASDAANGRAKQAVASIDQALNLIKNVRDSRDALLADITATWYKTWFPRVATANGRVFLHEVDDVKDHFPDRTIDMSYLFLRQIQLPMEAWAASVERSRNEYAAAHGLPSR